MTFISYAAMVALSVKLITIRKSAWDLFKAANTAVDAEYKKTELERTDTIHAG